MRRAFASLILVGLLIACNSAKKDNTDNSQILSDSTDIEQTEQLQNSDCLKIVGDSVEIPSFEIELKLSEKAEEKLKNDKESIIVMAYFTSTPVEDIPDKYKDNVDRLGCLFLLSHSIELTDKRLARFEHIKFPKDLYDLAADKDIQLLVNVFSGRRSSDLNLLDCDIIEDSMSQIKGKKFIINGKLISGD